MNIRIKTMLSGLLLLLCQSVMVKADVGTFGTAIAPGSDWAFDATAFENRLSKSQRFSCGDRTDTFLSELKSDLASMPSDMMGVGAAFDVCGASFESNTFLKDDAETPIEGGFMIGTNIQADVYYWVFIFLNDTEITHEILGERNLFLVAKGSVSSVPIAINNPGLVTKNLLSVLAVDARIASGDHYRFNSLFVSTEVKTQSVPGKTGGANISYIDGVPGSYNPYPAGLSYSVSGRTGRGNSELIFSIDPGSVYRELSTTFINFMDGRRIDADCGAASPGLVNIKYFDTKTISITCDLGDHDLNKSVLAVLTPDYFVDSSDSENSGAYGATFNRFYKTHQAVDAISSVRGN